MYALLRHGLIQEEAPQSMEHILQWKFIRDTAVIATGTNVYIPQSIYQPYTEADCVRYIKKANLNEPIIFVTSHPDQWGIALEDALRTNMKDLLGRDDHMFEDCGPSVSIRLQVTRFVFRLIYVLLIVTVAGISCLDKADPYHGF
jgi:nitrogen fixation protein